MQIPDFNGWTPEEVVTYCKQVLGTLSPEEIAIREKNRTIQKQKAEEYCQRQYEEGRRGYYKRTCPTCGKIFYTDNARRVYDDYGTCSSQQHRLNAKRRRERRRTTTCEECGKVFTPARAGAKYCCAACKQKAYRERKLKEHNDHTQQQ